MFRFAIIVFTAAALCGCTGEREAPVASSVDPVVATPAPAMAETTSPPSKGIVVANAPQPPRRPAELAAAFAAASPAETTVVAASPPPAEQQAPQAYASVEESGATQASFPGLFGGMFARADPAPASEPEPRASEEELEVEPPSLPEGGRTTKRSTAPGQRYYAAYNNTVVSCFPPRLREALNTIAEHYGRDVEVTSGHRTNGRRGSYHRKCMAADIRVPGVRPSELAAFAKTIDGVNGVGVYRHTSVTHVDIRDYQMSWRY